MARRIYIFDTTLRDGEQSPGCSMNLQEKLEVAHQLERLKVDVIEAGFAISSPGDFESVEEISRAVKNCTVASLARAIDKDIDVAYQAVKDAVSPRIHLFLATSPIHMRYKLKMTPEEVLERVEHTVQYAKKYCSDVEFSAEDALRSDKEFLAKVFKVAIDSGATTINVPDTVGYATHSEMQEYITYIKQNVENIDKAKISVHCHNDLGLAVSNSLAALKAGADQIECTINGLGERAGNTSLEEVVMGLNVRNSYYNAYCNVDTKQIYRTSKLVQSITGIKVPPNKAIVGANAFAHEAGIHQHGVLCERSTYEIMTPNSVGIPENKMVLGKHSGRHAFETRLFELGYTLTKEGLDKAFEQFKSIADKKKVVLDRDLEAIVVGKLTEMPQVYKFERFVINSGNTITSTAMIRVTSGDEVIEKVSTGDGPIDAAFKAINDIAGKEFALDEYSINAVTEGVDALGEAVAKLSYEGRQVIGRAISTDVIEASILAYLNGVNKLLLS